MIGKVYNKLFRSKYGEKYLDTVVTDEGMKWTEKGLSRFLFWNFMVFWAGLFTFFTFVGNFSPRYIITSIILSLYTKERMVPIMNEVMKDLDVIVEYEEEEPITEGRKYKILTDIMNGDDWYESIQRHTK